MNTPDEITGPMNLGNPGEFSILQLAEMIIRMTGSESKIVYEALPSDDPIQRQPDISFAAAQLGWKPKVELEEGLERTIVYFKELMGIKV